MERSEVQLSIQEGENGIRFLTIPEMSRSIPVYDFRNLDHQQEIAHSLASEGKVAMFAGVWGIFKGIKQNTRREEFFQIAKPGRPTEAKIPALMRPEDSVTLIDWSKVHPDFRFLSKLWEFEKLWKLHPGYLHIIAPVRPTLYSFPGIFQTSPEEFKKRYPNAESVPYITASFLFREDPYLRHLATLVGRFSHTRIFVGASTLNPHKKEPPYSFEELKKSLINREIPVEAIDLIVEDELYADFDAFGSHSQMVIPLLGEKPVFRMIRQGSLGIERFSQLTGFDCEPLGEIEDVRKNKGVSIDDELESMKESIDRRWKQERPRIFWRG